MRTRVTILTQLFPVHQRITTEDELRQLMGHPSELVRHKVIDRLDEHCRHFIGLSPCLFVSTADRYGECDVSPRGDAPGFVYVIDEKHLVIPDRPGNRRMDRFATSFRIHMLASFF